MRKLITLVFVCISFLSFAQKGSFSISNFGDRYRIKLTEIPKSPNLAYWNVRKLRVSVTCMQTFQTDVTFLPIDGFVDYKLNGNNLISCAVVYYNNSTYVGQKSIPTSKCIFGLNPSACYEKQ